ncbi:hypothetical protein OF846_000797 [Rhodotorula toruloides]|nr:hypothetical protein OF846_000797 [Rhodotorula toruloides]
MSGAATARRADREMNILEGAREVARRELRCTGGNSSRRRRCTQSQQPHASTKARKRVVRKFKMDAWTSADVVLTHNHLHAVTSQYRQQCSDLSASPRPSRSQRPSFTTAGSPPSSLSHTFV